MMHIKETYPTLATGRGSGLEKRKNASLKRLEIFGREKVNLLGISGGRKC